MFSEPSINLLVVLPVVIVATTGILLMVIDLFISEERRPWLGWIALGGLAAALVQSLGLWGNSYATFTPTGGHPMLVADNFSHFLNAIFLVTGILTVLFSTHYTNRDDMAFGGEYYMLLLFSISGMMLMGMANDLILVFLAIELLSIPLYILCAFNQPRAESEESAMKYFLLGAFSSGFLVFGIALLYGATGATALPDVLANIGPDNILGLIGGALLLVGFAFKVAAVPFHSWTPDVYEGAPTTVTAFMSVGAKVGGFAALMRVFIYALPELADTWVTALTLIAALTMILGNVVAISQQNIKRMLAYSSIAHAGYIMMAVAAASDPQVADKGVSAALFYMLAYVFSNLGAFAVVLAVERQDGSGLNLDDYKGLARRHPLLALALAYFMLSLTGIPPSGGFTGKFFVFEAAIESGLTWLAVVGVVTSVISAYFYLRPVFLSFMVDGEGRALVRPALAFTVVVAIVGTILLGLAPDFWYGLAQQAALAGGQIVAGG